MTEIETCDLAIIGAGAGGMAAAIAASCARGGGQGILLLERLPRPGKKILATGNGRCNLGNCHAPSHAYHNAAFAAPALLQCDAAVLETFFGSLGLALRADSEGRLYPRSNAAASVLDALRFGVQRAGIDLRCDTPIMTCEHGPRGFLLNGQIRAKRVLVAAGGCAAPAQGSDGSGLRLLAALGHPIVPPRPALTPLTARAPVLSMLKGLRAHAKITIEGHAATGELLFTEDGISGIAAMEVSRWAAPGTLARLDLAPEFTHAALTALLTRWQHECPEMDLAGLLPRRLGEAVRKTAQSDDPRDIAVVCKDFQFNVTGTRGFAAAQVMAGGADVAAFHPLTLESRLVPGLFACGEVLDVDGGCGGFNLHWAWASALVAGAAAV